MLGSGIPGHASGARFGMGVIPTSLSRGVIVLHGPHANHALNVQIGLKKETVVERSRSSWHNRLILPRYPHSPSYVTAYVPDGTFC